MSRVVVWSCGRAVVWSCGRTEKTDEKDTCVR
jgi:hypothetical protein